MQYNKDHHPETPEQFFLHAAEEAVDFGCWQYFPKDGTFQCSNGMAKIFGATADLRDPTVFLDHSVREDRAAAENIVHLIKNSPRPFEKQISIRAGNFLKTIKVKASLPSEGSGNSSVILGIVADITALSASERAYNEQTHLFSNILETVPGLISVINLSTFDIEYINRNFSFRLDERIPAPKDTARQLIHPDDGDALKGYIRNFLTADDQKVSTIEYRAKSDSGEWEWFRAHGKVFKRNEQGNPTHSVNVAQSIHAAKMAEEESARMREMVASHARRQYEDLFRSIDQGFVIVQLLFNNGVAIDCRILQTNPAFEKITTCRNVAGKTLRELLPAAPAEWLQALAGVLVENKEQRFTVLARELGNTWYDIYAFPAGGTESNVAVLFNDISERVRSAEELRVRQLKLDIAQRAGKVGIWTFDPITGRGMATEEWRNMIGYQSSSETWNLEDLLSLLEEHDVAAVRQAFSEAKQNEKIDVECRIKQHPQGVKWFLFRGSYFTATNGEGDSLMGSLIDITDQKALEEQKDQFIAIASHELKTPVTSIRAYAEVLLDFLTEKGDPAHAAMMTRMVSQARRLTRLINDLLDTTKIAGGAFSLEVQSVDLNHLIRERVEEIQQSTAHTFEVNWADIPPVVADKDRIGQVVTNLLSNAVKYSPEGSRIIITTSKMSGHVTVSVRDEGMGLPEETHGKIFDRFYRIEHAHDSAVPGLGLGLFIASEIIRRHRGTLTVKSKPGEGSEFFFTLPI